MHNLGEEIVGEYLKRCLDCDFVSYNVATKEVQGEIDVIGINTKSKHLYICEVAIHLETGLQYVRSNRPDNVDRLTNKFAKDIQYAKAHFSDHRILAMLWSPIVKNAKDGAKNNQMHDVIAIRNEIKKLFGVEIQLIINEKYRDCLTELRQLAAITTQECKSPVMRYLQIEEKLNKHLEMLSKRKRKVA